MVNSASLSKHPKHTKSLTHAKKSPWPEGSSNQLTTHSWHPTPWSSLSIQSNYTFEFPERYLLGSSCNCLPNTINNRLCLRETWSIDQIGSTDQRMAFLQIGNQRCAQCWVLLGRLRQCFWNFVFCAWSGVGRVAIGGGWAACCRGSDRFYSFSFFRRFNNECRLSCSFNHHCRDRRVNYPSFQQPHQCLPPSAGNTEIEKRGRNSIGGCAQNQWNISGGGEEFPYQQWGTHTEVGAGAIPSHIKRLHAYHHVVMVRS